MPDGDRRRVIETPAHERAAVRLLMADGSVREALAAIEPGFDLDDLAAYVWSGSPSLPEQYVPLVSGMAAALIVLGYEIGTGASRPCCPMCGRDAADPEGTPGCAPCDRRLAQ